MLECFQCGRVIPDGELHLSVDYQMERAHDCVITIDQSNSLLITCIDCSPSRRAVTDALRAAGFPVAHED